MAVTITVDTRQLGHLSQALSNLTRRQMGAAIRFGLNDAAFAARKDWQEEMKQRLILRNNFASNAVRVDKVTTWDINRMRSVVGSVAEFMDDVEDGQVEHKKGKHGVAVPMGYAAGADGQIPTRKMVKPAFRVGRVKITRAPSGNYVSDRQRNAVAMRIAKESGGKNNFVFLQKGDKSGVFRVFKRGKPKAVWSYSRPTVRMKPHPTLEPVVKRTARTLPRVFMHNIEKQIQRAFAQAGLR